jgi:hypothetical protein
MRLTKLFGAAALWILLGVAGSAAAASTVTLSFQLESGLGSTAVFGLYVQNSLGVGLGAVDVLVQGGTGFDLNTANPGISLADSVYSVRPIPGQEWDVLIINNVANGVTIAPPGATTRLGAFRPGDLPVLLPGETPDPSGPGSVLGGSLFDVNLQVITPISIGSTSTCGGEVCFGAKGLIFTVPEPAVPLSGLVPVILAVLALSRWSAYS